MVASLKIENRELPLVSIFSSAPLLFSGCGTANEEGNTIEE